MKQAEGPNKYTLIAFVLNQVRLIWSLFIMNTFLGPLGVHNKRHQLYCPKGVHNKGSWL